MPKTYTRVLIDMLAPDLMSPTAIIEADSFEDTRPVAACKKGREQAQQAAQLQAQAAQQQAGLVPYQIQQMQSQNALAQQQEALSTKAQQEAQGLAERQFAAAQQVQAQQEALAKEEEGRAQEQYGLKKNLISSNLGYLGGLQPELDKLKSPYGQLTPAAQAQYASDIDNINSTYKNALETSQQQMGFRGLAGRPQGAASSMTNANNNARAAQQTGSYRQGLANTQNQNETALQGEMNLANMKNSLVNAYNPEGDYGLVNTSLANAGGLTGGMQGANSTALGGLGLGETGLAQAGGSLSGGSNSVSGASGALTGSANAAGGEANSAQVLNSMGSPVGNILGAIGSVAAAPFTGGTSLAGLGFNALKPLFQNRQATTTASPSGIGLFG